MNYFKKENMVYAFDENQLDLITNDFVKMTDEEIDRHLNPEKYLTEDEKRAAYLASLKNLTRRQFKLTLLDFDLLDTIESKIAAIEDKATRQRIQIEYTEALEFNRTSDSVLYMCQMLELTESQVDEMWEHAMQIPT